MSNCTNLCGDEKQQHQKYIMTIFIYIGSKTKEESWVIKGRVEKKSFLEVECLNKEEEPRSFIVAKK